MKAKREAILHIYLSIYRRFWVCKVGIYSLNGANNFCESDFSSLEMANGIKIGLSYQPVTNTSILAYRLHFNLLYRL